MSSHTKQNTTARNGAQRTLLESDIAFAAIAQNSSDEAMFPMVIAAIKKKFSPTDIIRLAIRYGATDTLVDIALSNMIALADIKRKHDADAALARELADADASKSDDGKSVKSQNSDPPMWGDLDDDDDAVDIWTPPSKRSDSDEGKHNNRAQASTYANRLSKVPDPTPSEAHSQGFTPVRGRRSKSRGANSRSKTPSRRSRSQSRPRQDRQQDSKQATNYSSHLEGAAPCEIRASGGDCRDGMHGSKKCWFDSSFTVADLIQDGGANAQKILGWTIGGDNWLSPSQHALYCYRYTNGKVEHATVNPDDGTITPIRPKIYQTESRKTGLRSRRSD